MSLQASATVANLPDDALEPITTVVKTGIYYGYAQLVLPANEASKFGEKDLTVLPMVMSLGFNPFYNNKKLTAVSQGNGLCGVGLIGECRRSMSYTPSLVTFMVTKYASSSWVISGPSWTTSPGVSRFSRWPGAGPAYIDSRRGAYRGHQHRHPHWTQVSRTGSLLCIRTRHLVFAVDVEQPHLLSPVNILWQPLLLLSLRCRIQRTNRYFAWSNICNLDMAGRRLDRRKSLPQWRRI